MRYWIRLIVPIALKTIAGIAAVELVIVAIVKLAS